MSFVPDFQTSVQGVAPNGLSFPVSPSFCATEDCAANLAKVLADLGAKVVHGSPIPNIGNRFKYPSVPFLTFANGNVRNAGVLATYWVWFNPTLAEQCARIDAEDTSYPGSELLAS